MKLFFYLLLFVVIAAFGLTFSLKNPQLVELSYYPDIVISAPIAIVLLVTLLLGMLLGILTSLIPFLRKRRELMKSKREIRRLIQELQKLTPLVVKDTD